jgi:hypothetical protein
MLRLSNVLQALIFSSKCSGLNGADIIRTLLRTLCGMLRRVVFAQDYACCRTVICTSSDFWGMKMIGVNIVKMFVELVGG